MLRTEQIAVGEPLPIQAGRHAISGSLPTWFSHIGAKEDDPRIMNLMQTGYPRFWIHWNIRKLSRYFEAKYSTGTERILLLRSATAAKECQAFLHARDVPARILDYQRPKARPGAGVHVILCPSASFPTAMEFWTYTGLGITTRLADYHISLLDVVGKESVFDKRSINDLGAPELANDITAEAARAKLEIRRRLADLRQTEIDAVWLYVAGMHAIWSAHQVCMTSLGQLKSVCFGFPYVDTLKVLEKWGPGCYFYPDGSDRSIDELEQLLGQLSAENPTEPPILALFTEIPSNPLLRTINLPRLRQLADKYDFPIVIDDTVSNFVNVNPMPYVDVIVSSLSKLFSGRADVMGGSLILNKAGKHYHKLQAQLAASYEDLYFDEDVIVMERNSRDFVSRVVTIGSSTEAIAEYLRSCISVVKDVYYPKWQTPENYNICRRPTGPAGGYGGLFSIIFASIAAAQGFFDALPCPKGPSFGTYFTLVCPYTIMAHYGELDWAAGHGVPVEMVRVWIGMEPLEELMQAFTLAIVAAENAHKQYAPGQLPGAVWTVGC